MGITAEPQCGMVFVRYGLANQRSAVFGLLDDHSAFHLGVKGAYVRKIAGVSELMTPRLPSNDRAGIK